MYLSPRESPVHIEVAQANHTCSSCTQLLALHERNRGALFEQLIGCQQTNDACARAAQSSG